MKKYNLFLDDERTLRDAWRITHKTEYLNPNWLIVKNYGQFCHTIEQIFIQDNEFPELISFDHDLGDEQKTGYDCAKWLVEFCMEHKLELPKYIIHTMNPVGRENIEKYFSNYIKSNENSNGNNY